MYLCISFNLYFSGVYTVCVDELLQLMWVRSAHTHTHKPLGRHCYTNTCRLQCDTSLTHHSFVFFFLRARFKNHSSSVCSRCCCRTAASDCLSEGVSPRRVQCRRPRHTHTSSFTLVVSVNSSHRQDSYCLHDVLAQTTHTRVDVCCLSCGTGS